MTIEKLVRQSELDEALEQVRLAKEVICSQADKLVKANEYIEELQEMQKVLEFEAKIDKLEFDLMMLRAAINSKNGK